MFFYANSYRNGRTRTVCYLLWPDGRYPLSAADYMWVIVGIISKRRYGAMLLVFLLCVRYNIVFLVLTYGVPMFFMVVCYTLMGRELWGSQSIGEHTERQRESVMAKKKVIYRYRAATHKSFHFRKNSLCSKWEIQLRLLSWFYLWLHLLFDLLNRRINIVCHGTYLLICVGF